MCQRVWARFGVRVHESASPPGADVSDYQALQKLDLPWPVVPMTYMCVERASTGIEYGSSPNGPTRPNRMESFISMDSGQIIDANWFWR